MIINFAAHEPILWHIRNTVWSVVSQNHALQCITIIFWLGLTFVRSRQTLAGHHQWLDGQIEVRVRFTIKKNEDSVQHLLHGLLLLSD